MTFKDQRIEKVTRDLTDMLNDLLDKGAGIPRPIIGLNKEMPFFLPIKQRSVSKLKRLVEDNKLEFETAKLIFIVNPYQDQSNRRITEINYPYAELLEGEVINRLDDESEVKLAKIIVKDVPEDWKSERTLDLVIQAISKNKRYGQALAVSNVINLRVPRFAIEGKETGV